MEAMAKLGKRWPTLRFAIVGGDGAEGAMGGELRQLAARLKIADRVVFAGTARREELAAWYGAADLFVLASAHEGCPNVVLEALACGTPVVGTPAGNIPELLDSPEVGVVVERTVDSIAAGIDAALERGWDRDKVRARVAGRTWEAVGREQAEELRAAVGCAVRTGAVDDGAHSAPYGPAEEVRP
jgi:glycosyltransferase involved in cell wall biosynthesis